MVIIDEAQWLKNPEADISRAVKRLPRRIGWALSGTPLENRLDDLISILDFVAPDRFHSGTLAWGLRRLLSECFASTIFADRDNYFCRLSPG